MAVWQHCALRRILGKVNSSILQFQFQQVFLFIVTVAAAPEESKKSELTNAEEVKVFIFEDLSKVFNLTSDQFNKLTSTDFIDSGIIQSI